MKYLIVARHGDFNTSLNLSELGKEQISELTGAILKRSDNEWGRSGNNIIFSSNVPYVRESADLLASVLGIVEVEESKILADGTVEGIHELVSDYRERVDGLILVTHVEFASSYPEYFTEIEFGEKIYLPDAGKGEAYSLNLHRRKWSFLSSSKSNFL